MSGSGMVLRVATENGIRALGLDVDPLAVLLSKVWTTPIDEEALVRAGDELTDEAATLNPADLVLSWLDCDLETQTFVE